MDKIPVTEIELDGYRAGLATVWTKARHKPSGIEISAREHESKESLLFRIREAAAKAAAPGGGVAALPRAPLNHRGK